MTATAPARAREAELESLRLALHGLLAAHRQLRSRDSRQAGAIGFAHYRLMAKLREVDGQTVSHLAAAADLSPATVTEMVDALVTAELVARERDATDRRVVRVSLTRRGRRAFDAKRARFIAAWNRELADLDAGALEEATLVLERLTTFFERL